MRFTVGREKFLRSTMSLAAAHGPLHEGFDFSAVDEETKRVTAAAIADAEKSPPQHELPHEEVRTMWHKIFHDGAMKSYTAAAAGGEVTIRRNDREVASPRNGHKVKVSIFLPPAGASDLRGSYLHLHGGGWVYGGSQWQNDERLLEMMCHHISVTFAAMEHKIPTG